MKTPNKIIFIITVLLAGIVLATSCSKKTKTNAERKAAQKTVVNQASPAFAEGQNSLNAVRNGQYVTLNWQIDPAIGKIKQINILRSLTATKNQEKVASMDSKTSSYKDSLPDENPYWYSLQVVKEDGKSKKVGPVRVEMDSAGSDNYTNVADKYKISITRTDDFATIKWDFPDSGYKNIQILRYTQAMSELVQGKFKAAAKSTTTAKGKTVPKGKATSKGKAPAKSNGKKGGGGVLVAETMEKKSQCKNSLPDANLDYWYWFRITLKSGDVINKGPIKAEYADQ